MQLACLLTAKLVKNRCCLDLRQHFLSEHVVDRWNGLDQCVIDSASHCEFVQEWVTANVTKQDGLLHGLIQSAGPYRPHLVLKIFPRIGVAAPGKSHVRLWVCDHCDILQCAADSKLSRSNPARLVQSVAVMAAGHFWAMHTVTSPCQHCRSHIEFHDISPGAPVSDRPEHSTETA